METKTATTIFESLSSGWRLEAFRLLVKKGPEGMVAGDIAATLDLAPSSLSFHLKALTHAGMVSVEQEGRFLRYRANLSLMAELIAYLQLGSDAFTTTLDEATPEPIEWQASAADGRTVTRRARLPRVIFMR